MDNINMDVIIDKIIAILSSAPKTWRDYADDCTDWIEFGDDEAKCDENYVCPGWNSDYNKCIEGKIINNNIRSQTGGIVKKSINYLLYKKNKTQYIKISNI
jgi:hypothetical protein